MDKIFTQIGSSFIQKESRLMDLPKNLYCSTGSARYLHSYQNSSNLNTNQLYPAGITMAKKIYTSKPETHIYPYQLIDEISDEEAMQVLLSAFGMWAGRDDLEIVDGHIGSDWGFIDWSEIDEPPISA